MERDGDIWIIANSDSGGTDADAIRALHRHIEQRGVRVVRTVDLSVEDMPPSDELDGETPPIIAAYGGDGTATAVVSTYGHTQAPLLILPGGTMNLLAGKLHGDGTLDEIVDGLLGGMQVSTVHLPIVQGEGWSALTGVIAGPATAWGDVREHLRQGDVGALVEAAVEAFTASRTGPRIALDNSERDFPAIFVEAAPDALVADAIEAESLGEMALHGLAWLKRDFLGGPRERIGSGAALTLRAEGQEIGLLVDGERKRAGPELFLRHGQCPAHFLSARQTCPQER